MAGEQWRAINANVGSPGQSLSIANNAFNRLGEQVGAKLAQDKANVAAQEQLKYTRGRNTALDLQNKQLFDVKMAELERKRIGDVATQDAAKAVLMPETYASNQIAAEQAGIAESMANLPSNEQAELQAALEGYRKSITPVNGSFADTDRGKAILGESVTQPNVNIIDVQNAIPRAGNVAKKSELQTLVDLYGKDKAGAMKYGSKSTKDKSSTYNKATQAIGNLGNAEEVGELWRRAANLGVRDRFVDELSIAGAYNDKKGLFDFGGKDIPTKRLRAVIAEAEKNRNIKR